MRPVIVDISKIDNLNCGLGQFSYHLSKELALIDKDISFYYSSKVKNVPSGVAQRLIAAKKLYRKIPYLAPKPRIWHAIHQDCDIYPVGGKTKGILTIHDLNFLSENLEIDKQKRYLERLQKKIDKSEALVFISEFTKREVQKHLNVEGRKQVVIPNGISLNSTDDQLRPALLQFSPGSYFFGISTIVPKKNYELLVDLAHKLKDAKFVIAGDLFHLYADQLQKRVVQEGLGNRFQFIGKVSEQEKNYLYQNCKAFVHPSLLEGFGLPLVEALFFGKAVLCSELCSMPEVVGEDGFYFNPANIDTVVEAFEKFEKADHDPVKYRRRAEEFSWQKAAKSYSDLYQEILGDFQA